MAVFMPRTNKDSVKAPEFFTKLADELDMDKYNLQKYKELFMLSSFQAMYDTDLAYNDIYLKCARNAQSKGTLLNCLNQEEKLTFKHPDCFDNFIFRQNMLKAVGDIKRQLLAGSLDYLFT